jgi:hypothetical protein
VGNLQHPFWCGVLHNRLVDEHRHLPGLLPPSNASWLGQALGTDMRTSKN